MGDPLVDRKGFTLEPMSDLGSTSWLFTYWDHDIRDDVCASYICPSEPEPDALLALIDGAVIYLSSLVGDAYPFLHSPLQNVKPEDGDPRGKVET